MLFGVAYGQLCADEDTVRSNAVTLITANTARVNGTVSHFTGAPTSLQLRYVRVGQTDTATASSTPTSALRNLTGLQAGTAYYYYYKTICGSGTRSQTIGAYTFTTLANTIFYAPERPTIFNHVKVDSSMIIPAGDTVVGREPSTGAQIRYKSSNNTFYGYYPSCTCWRPLAIDSAGIIALLDGKVDSVTVSGDSLFYWKVGVSYGYILPALNDVWRNTGNTGIDTSVNWLGTNDANDLVIKTNGTRRMSFRTNGALDYDADSTNINFDDIDNFEVTNVGSAILLDGKTGGYSSQVGVTSGYSVTIGTYESAVGTHNSAIEVYNELIEITPYQGNITIDTLANLSVQNAFLGWTSTSGANRGKIGYLTPGTGIEINVGAINTKWTTSGNDIYKNNSGNVGIGTTTPTSKLHISESGVSGSITTSYIESIGATTTNRTLRLKAANAVNNIALAIENGEGNVGIGTLTPAATLHTVGTVRMASLGSASTDTTTYKPVGISSLGDVIPMTAWPQQVTASSTTTFTNKRWTARVGSTTSSATPTINTDNVDIYKLTAQTVDVNTFSTNLSGSPADGDILELQVTGTAARALAWGSSFVSTTVTLPTTTVSTTTLTIILQYYTTSSYGNNKWHCVNYY